jgi:hypothetical protein
MLKRLEYSKWLSVAALLMFVGATFQIADGHWVLAAVCFGPAASFMALSAERGKLENDELQQR